MRTTSLILAASTLVLVMPISASAQPVGSADTTVTTTDTDRDDEGFPWGLLGLLGLAGLIPRKHKDTVHTDRATMRP